MANYYTLCCFVVPCDTVEQADELVSRFGAARERAMETDDYDDDPACDEIARYADKAGQYVRIASSEAVNISAVAAILQRWMREVDPKVRFIGFEYACTCSQARLDAYGGGCVGITRSAITTLGTGVQLAKFEKRMLATDARRTAKTRKHKKRSTTWVIERQSRCTRP